MADRDKIKYDFNRHYSLAELRELQGVKPITDPSSLIGGWPEDEPVEPFIEAYREWRGHKKSKDDQAA